LIKLATLNYLISIHSNKYTNAFDVQSVQNLKKTSIDTISCQLYAGSYITK